MMFSKSVGEEVTEGEMSDTLVVAMCEERGHGDDIFRIVVLDVLEPSEFALARFLIIDKIGGLDILLLFINNKIDKHLTFIVYRQQNRD